MKLSKDWIYSDDTAMHIATVQTLCSSMGLGLEFYQTMLSNYKKSLQNMKNRSPGLTCMKYIRSLHSSRPLDSKFNE